MNISNYGSNPYGTHRPCLINLIKNTNGNIIEFGCGDTSTVLIKEIIKGTNRKLVTFESNKSWLNKYKHMEDENHKFHFIDSGNVDESQTAQKWIDYIENSEVKNMKFDVVFIDSSPWTSRTYLLNYYKNKAKYIIVHDCGYFPNNKLWGKVDKNFTMGKYRAYIMNFSDIAKNYKVYYPYLKYFALSCGPATLLLSNTVTKDEFNKISEKIYENNQYYDKNIFDKMTLVD